MGGRIHGFLGGVLLTSAITYYTSQYIQKNQQFISHQLRTSENIINNRILSDKDLQKPLEPISSHITTTGRVSFGETCKDIWNDEIITMVNWIYSINWYQWGVELDKSVVKAVDSLKK
ncbi:uncharacterized protein J8A68_001879 [[Candida] subhashii]|uniref:MICOS complex subunit MIC12 n=1 Tax=[Candida] subhashii TaxID=561895 RepID=A0A8J5QN67_9ASCO|nr:uncharacterized protein J8A68_001879 [[Candida] subhashii]KAG7664584.1 hypothetical protein J8A68_001879 [[Candida] subhashii]